MKTMSVNTKMFGCMELVGADFNSGTTFNGKLYFATDDGLKKEDGDRDGELDVNATISFSVPQSPLGLGHIFQTRTIRTVSILGKIKSAIVLTISSGNEEFSTTVDTSNHGWGVRIGVDKKVKGWIQKVTISNRDGGRLNLSKSIAIIIPGPGARI